MQEKQKVTLYLPDDLHRQLKIRSAVDREPMSALDQKALNFYLAHSEVVDSFREYGQTHRVYSCPACATTLTLQPDGLSIVKHHSCVQADGAIANRLTEQAESVVPDVIPAGVSSDDAPSDKGELVPC